MKRLIENELLAWKDRSSRRPLLLRGARQVGKTWSIRQLGKEFPQFIECNFEQNHDLAMLFEGDLSPIRLCERISAFTGQTIMAGKTLLFLDEIQACPNALRSLRFFYEQLPEVHVAAAGSLLEFASEELPSYGVGRIESLYLWPLTFREFLTARSEVAMLDVLLQERESAPVAFHERLLESLRFYMVLGGMPAVVQKYQETHDLKESERELDILYAGLQDDFVKYNSRVPAHRIQDVFQAVVLQAGGKFVFNRVSPELDARQVKAALNLLRQAGLVHSVMHSSAQGIPLGAQVNPRRFKVIPADLGLYNRILKLPAADVLFGDEKKLVNKGAVAEIFAGLEFMARASSHSKAELFYWQKEKRDGNAEIDYVLQKGMEIVPIEVKSGTRGAMQSMRVFLESHPASQYGVRTSLEAYGAIGGQIKIIPLYALGDWCST